MPPPQGRTAGPSDPAGKPPAGSSGNHCSPLLRPSAAQFGCCLDSFVFQLASGLLITTTANDNTDSVYGSEAMIHQELLFTA